VVAASVFAVGGGLDLGVLDTSPLREDAPAPATRPTAPTPGNSIVGGWEIVGEPQWIPLRNGYNAATVYAVNRTSLHLRSQIAFVLWAAYEDPDAPVKFEAPCDVIEVTGEPPANQEDLFAAPLREGAVAPGEKVLISCVQVHSATRYLRQNRPQIDVETARFRIAR
jgi:hypothetical protein